MEICVDKTVSNPVSTSAAVNLARVVGIAWDKVDPDDFNDENIEVTGNISKEDKSFFRQNIISRIH